MLFQTYSFHGTFPTNTTVTVFPLQRWKKKYNNRNILLGQISQTELYFSQIYLRSSTLVLIHDNCYSTSSGQNLHTIRNQKSHLPIQEHLIETQNQFPCSFQPQHTKPVCSNLGEKPLQHFIREYANIPEDRTLGCTTRG